MVPDPLENASKAADSWFIGTSGPQWQDFIAVCSEAPLIQTVFGVNEATVREGGAAYDMI